MAIYIKSIDTQTINGVNCDYSAINDYRINVLGRIRSVDISKTTLPSPLLILANVNYAISQSPNGKFLLVDDIITPDINPLCTFTVQGHTETDFSFTVEDGSLYLVVNGAPQSVIISYFYYVGTYVGALISTDESIEITPLNGNETDIKIAQNQELASLKLGNYYIPAAFPVIGEGDLDTEAIYGVTFSTVPAPPRNLPDLFPPVGSTVASFTSMGDILNNWSGAQFSSVVIGSPEENYGLPQPYALPPATADPPPATNLSALINTATGGYTADVVPAWNAFDAAFTTLAGIQDFIDLQESTLINTFSNVLVPAYSALNGAITAAPNYQLLGTWTNLLSLATDLSSPLQSFSASFNGITIPPNPSPQLSTGFSAAQSALSNVASAIVGYRQSIQAVINEFAAIDPLTPAYAALMTTLGQCNLIINANIGPIRDYAPPNQFVTLFNTLMNNLVIIESETMPAAISSKSIPTANAVAHIAHLTYNFCINVITIMKNGTDPTLSNIVENIITIITNAFSNAKVAYMTFYSALPISSVADNKTFCSIIVPFMTTTSTYFDQYYAAFVGDTVNFNQLTNASGIAPAKALIDSNLTLLNAQIAKITDNTPVSVWIAVAKYASTVAAKYTAFTGLLEDMGKPVVASYGTMWDMIYNTSELASSAYGFYSTAVNAIVTTLQASHPSAGLITSAGPDLPYMGLRAADGDTVLDWVPHPAIEGTGQIVVTDNDDRYTLTLQDDLLVSNLSIGASDDYYTMPQKPSPEGLQYLVSNNGVLGWDTLISTGNGSTLNLVQGNGIIIDPDESTPGAYTLSVGSELDVTTLTVTDNNLQEYNLPMPPKSTANGGLALTNTTGYLMGYDGTDKLDWIEMKAGAGLTFTCTNGEAAGDNNTPRRTAGSYQIGLDTANPIPTLNVNELTIKETITPGSAITPQSYTLPAPILLAEASGDTPAVTAEDRFCKFIGYNSNGSNSVGWLGIGTQDPNLTVAISQTGYDISLANELSLEKLTITKTIPGTGNMAASVKSYSLPGPWEADPDISGDAPAGKALILDSTGQPQWQLPDVADRTITAGTDNQIVAVVNPDNGTDDSNPNKTVISLANTIIKDSTKDSSGNFKRIIIDSTFNPAGTPTDAISLLDLQTTTVNQVAQTTQKNTVLLDCNSITINNNINVPANATQTTINGESVQTPKLTITNKSGAALYSLPTGSPTAVGNSLLSCDNAGVPSWITGTGGEITISNSSIGLANNIVKESAPVDIIALGNAIRIGHTTSIYTDPVTTPGGDVIGLNLTKQIQTALPPGTSFTTTNNLSASLSAENLTLTNTNVANPLSSTQTLISSSSLQTPQLSVGTATAAPLYTFPTSAPPAAESIIKFSPSGVGSWSTDNAGGSSATYSGAAGEISITPGGIIGLADTIIKAYPPVSTDIPQPPPVPRVGYILNAGSGTLSAYSNNAAGNLITGSTISVSETITPKLTIGTGLAGAAINQVYSLPTSAPSPGQVMSAITAGQLGWSEPHITKNSGEQEVVFLFGYGVTEGKWKLTTNPSNYIKTLSFYVNSGVYYNSAFNQQTIGPTGSMKIITIDTTGGYNSILPDVMQIVGTSAVSDGNNSYICFVGVKGITNAIEIYIMLSTPTIFTDGINYTICSVNMPTVNGLEFWYSYNYI